MKCATICLFSLVLMSLLTSNQAVGAATVDEIRTQIAKLSISENRSRRNVLYNALGVNRGSTNKEITIAFEKIDDPTAIQIVARKILLTPKMRAEYDAGIIGQQSMPIDPVYILTVLPTPLEMTPAEKKHYIEFRAYYDTFGMPIERAAVADRSNPNTFPLSRRAERIKTILEFSEILMSPANLEKIKLGGSQGGADYKIDSKVPILFFKYLFYPFLALKPDSHSLRQFWINSERILEFARLRGAFPDSGEIYKEFSNRMFAEMFRAAFESSNIGAQLFLTILDIAKSETFENYSPEVQNNKVLDQFRRNINNSDEIIREVLLDANRELQYPDIPLYADLETLGLLAEHVGVKLELLEGPCNGTLSILQKTKFVE